MTVAQVLWFNDECKLENLVDMPFGVVDVEDGMVCMNNNDWRPLRVREAQQVDKRLHLETVISHATYDDSGDEPDVNYGLGYQGASVSMSSEDIYTDGIGKGFTL